MVRLARAELKRRVADGEIPVAEVVRSCPPVVKNLTIAELLMLQPRWGSYRCRKFLERLGVSEMKTLGRLTDRQREMVIAALSKQAALVVQPLSNLSEEASEWEELEAIARRSDSLIAELGLLNTRRDELIRSLSEGGASRRSVADAAALTVGRVQQIVSDVDSPVMTA
jgi:hypothetical protein